MTGGHRSRMIRILVRKENKLTAATRIILALPMLHHIISTHVFSKIIFPRIFPQKVLINRMQKCLLFQNISSIVNFEPYKKIVKCTTFRFTYFMLG